MTRQRSMSRSSSLRDWTAPWRAALNSLQFKASLLVILLVLIVTISGLGLSLRMVTDLAYGRAEAGAREWAENLASCASTLVQQKSTEALVRTVNDTLHNQTVSYVVFADERQRLIACGEEMNGLLAPALTEGGQVLRIDALGQPRLIRDPMHATAYFDVTVPVYAQSPMPGQPRASRRVIGYLRLATSVAPLDAQIRQISWQLRRVATCMLLLTAVCSLVAMRKVVAPLNELSNTARQLAGGVMDARAKVLTHNEIGDLARAFNDMADRLAGAQFEMLRLNSELEERVQQRTHQLEDLASRDALTGLYNRRYFSDVITREFAAAERYDADLTCLMFDLDHFKQTNDRFGHRAGDQVLTIVADSIRHELRDSDVAARFGGDEFILLLPRTSASAAANVADRIVSRFAEGVAAYSPDLPTTLSIGVASLRITRARSAEALIHEADLALYSAKMGGRNRTISAQAASAAG
jgi:diguanylate cyclase (GGDEF)-like protein